MSLQDQQARFLKLNGEPIHMNLIDRIKTQPSFRAAGLTAVFNLCAAAALSPEAMLFSLGGTAVGLLGAEKLSEAYDSLFARIYFGKNFRELAIDKTPKANSTPTSPNNMRASFNTRTGAGLLTLVTGDKLLLVGIYGLALLGGAIQKGAGDPSNLAFGLGLLGSVASYMGFHFGKKTLSHHRVLKKEYVITDMPKPEKQEEKAPAFKMLPA